MTYQSIQLLNILIFGGIVFALTAAIIVLSFLLGERHKERATGEPYESGIAATGDAHLRFSQHFYVIAMFFVIFDLETVFLVAWALAFREAGWAGYAAVLVFVSFILALLIYEWRSGALDFAVKGKDILKAMKK